MMRAPLGERLDHLALTFLTMAWDEEQGERQLRDFLRDHAASLAEFADQARDEYAPLTSDGDVPTNAQGFALARFLRGHFRHDDVMQRIAHVHRGGGGLSDDYLHVRFGDGYEGGIDREGRTST